MTDTNDFTEAFDADEAAKRFNSLNHANGETIKVLLGRGAILQPVQMTAQRMELVVDALFGPMGETAERLAFEVAWQERLQLLLGEALNETAGQSIIVPKANGAAGGLHLP